MKEKPESKTQIIERIFNTTTEKRKTRRAKETREPLAVGAPQGNNSVDKWSDEQRRLGGAWSKHEIEALYDKLTAPYPWVPAWTVLSAEEIQYQLGEFYAAKPHN